MAIRNISHHAAALAQVGLSYVIIGSYCGAIAAEGLGYLSSGVSGGLKDLVMLVGFFWFQRQRATDPTPTQETKPQ